MPDPEVKNVADQSAWAPFVEAFWMQAAPRLEAVAERAADHFGLLQKAKLWRAKNIIEDIGPAFARAFLEELGREAQSMGGEHVAALQLLMTGPGPGAGQEAEKPKSHSDTSGNPL